MAKLLLCLSLIAGFAITSSQSASCTDDLEGYDYRGQLNETLQGFTCQAWSSQTPHKHGVTPSKFPNGGIEGNYCRNPDEDGYTAWCYTTDPDVRWQYCAVGSFDPECYTETECYVNPNATDYRGTVATTRSGKTCQKWNAQTPHKHVLTPESYPDVGLGDHNYCRNPGQELPNNVGFAWCYTTDPNLRWEYCDIGMPDYSCSY